jgi:hypothetical protein
MCCKHLDRAVDNGDVTMETTRKLFGGEWIICYCFRIGDVTLAYCPFCGEYLPEWERE